MYILHGTFTDQTVLYFDILFHFASSSSSTNDLVIRQFSNYPKSSLIKIAWKMVGILQCNTLAKLYRILTREQCTRVLTFQIV